MNLYNSNESTLIYIHMHIRNILHIMRTFVYLLNNNNYTFICLCILLIDVHAMCTIL